MQLHNKRILITGGSSGVGLALTEALVQRHNHVLITGRNAERLTAVAERLGERATPFVCDQSDPEAIDQLVAFVQTHWGRFDVLINNAAIQYNYLLPEQPLDEIVERVQYETAVNFTSVVHLTTACLPLLMADGIVVNITSGLALAPKRSAAVYSATKAALHAFSQALRWQLADTPRTQRMAVVEALLPMVDTPMTAGRGRGKIPPAQAAAEILRGIERRKAEVNVGKVKLLRFLLWAAPRVGRTLFRNS